MSPATISASRGGLFGIGALVLLIMWMIFIVRIMLGLPNDSRRAALRRDRSLCRHRRAAPARRRHAEGLGPVAPLRRLRRPRRASPGLVYDALRRRASSAYLMGEDTPRAVAARHAASRARARSRRDRAAGRRRALCAAAADRGRARAARAPPTSTARRRMCSAIIRNGSIRSSPACSATSAPRRARRCRRARRSICASTRSRPRATRRRTRSPISRPSRRAGRRWACASSFAPTPRSPAIHAEPALSQGPDRNPGRGLAARRAAGRRQARRAGARSLRRRRRQDAGARGR